VCGKEYSQCYIISTEHQKGTLFTLWIYPGFTCVCKGIFIVLYYLDRASERLPIHTLNTPFRTLVNPEVSSFVLWGKDRHMDLQCWTLEYAYTILRLLVYTHVYTRTFRINQQIFAHACISCIQHRWNSSSILFWLPDMYSRAMAHSVLIIPANICTCERCMYWSPIEIVVCISWMKKCFVCYILYLIFHIVNTRTFWSDISNLS